MSEITLKKKQMEVMQLELGVLKSETRILEIADEKERLEESIKEQKERLKEIKSALQK